MTRRRNLLEIEYARRSTRLRMLRTCATEFGSDTRWAGRRRHRVTVGGCGIAPRSARGARTWELDLRRGPGRGSPGPAPRIELKKLVIPYAQH